MVGLTGTRVLVIDDDEDEILDLVRVLWGGNVSALYVNPGDLDGAVPPAPFRGVRLVFLDMDIVGGGADEKSKLSALGNCLRKVLDEKNGPYVMVAWTKQPWLVERLDEYLLGFPAIPRPVRIVTITKSDCQEDGRFRLDRVRARVNESLISCPPLKMLQTWEHEYMASASDVVAELSRIANDGTETPPDAARRAWEKRILDLMFHCASEQAGRKNLLDGSATFSALCHALNPLVADRAELRIEPLAAFVADSSPRLLEVDAKARCPLEAAARINTMLHCSFDRPAEPFSGSVYIPGGDAGFNSLFPRLEDLLRGVLLHGLDADQGKKDMEAIKVGSRQVLMEANPTCDHVQKKVVTPRLIGGALIPFEFRNLLKKMDKPWPDYLWRLGPLALPPEGPARPMLLITHSLLVTSSTFDILRAQQALFRMRPQAFAAMQAWFAGHAARPGMLVLGG